MPIVVLVWKILKIFCSSINFNDQLLFPFLTYEVMPGLLRISIDELCSGVTQRKGNVICRDFNFPMQAVGSIESIE